MYKIEFHLKTKRIVITGGPGSGKTTVIQHLAQKGFDVMHEISRQITLEAQQNGTEQLFLKDPMLFSRKLMEGRLQQFFDAEKCDKKILFYDRGIGDVPAYLDFAKIDYQPDFAEPCHINRYDMVFILPPWEAIYHSDNERYESFEQADEIFEYLKTAYLNFGYNICEVPTGTVEERVDFILDFIKNQIEKFN